MSNLIVRDNGRWHEMTLHLEDSTVQSMWEDAQALDPESMSWVRILGRSDGEGGSSDVRIEIADHKHRELAGDGDRPVGRVVARALYREASDVLETEFRRRSFESIPVAGPTIPDSGIRVRWALVEAYRISGEIYQSLGEVGRIQLMRLHELPVKGLPDSMEFVVHLPEPLLRQVSHMRTADLTDLSEHVFHVIARAAKAEGPRKRDGVEEVGWDEIPF